ncbi:unnamed protein product [Heterobilharzia americana]|nr:unnamed protein product [Heterobilharzia americana]
MHRLLYNHTYTAILEECYTHREFNLGSYIFSIILGIFGILLIVFNTCISIIWIIYIIGWKTTKVSYDHNVHTEGILHLTVDLPIKNSNTNNIVTATTTTTTTTTIVPDCMTHNTINRNFYKPVWPKCSLRISTQIYIFSIIICDLVGHMSSVLRFTVLSMTGKDLRLLFGESMCRIQLYLSFSSTSISGWQFVFLCFERCYILSRPKSNYTLTPKIYWSAMMLTIFTLITTFIVDAYVFLPNENVCKMYYYNPVLLTIKVVYTLLLPAMMIIISSVILLVFLIKMKIHIRNINLSGRCCNNHNRLNIKERILVAKRMFIIAICHLILQTITVVFVKTVEKYCCYYTSEKILEITDYMYILLNLLRWSTHSLRSFLLITGSSIINHDVKLILNIFKINIKSFLNI